MLCLSFRFSIFYIVFIKEGDFTLFTKTILSPGKLLFARWVYCSFFVFPPLVSLPSPSLLPAIGEKISNQKGSFFLFEIFFTYRVNAKNQKNIVTEKGDKKFLLLFLSFIFYLSFTGRRLNHKR